MRREMYFGLAIMGLIVAAVIVFMPWGDMKSGHLGLLMLALVVVAIMLGFPTAFTLMGMGMLFAYIAYRMRNPDLAVGQTLDLMVQRAYSVMSNDVLISIPLFVFMGYLVERANLIEKLFKSLHLALSRVPGSLAVATLFTCAVFATATGIVGAVVTLMGLLALPAMLRAGYSTGVSAGAITAGGCLGILIPPSVMLIVYGATAGVSVVQLYAGAFFPGIMLAGLYIVYVVVLAKLRPDLMPPLPEAERRVPLTPAAEAIATRVSTKVLPGLAGAMKGSRNAGVSLGDIARQALLAALPALFVAALLGLTWRAATAPVPVEDTAGLVEMGAGASGESSADGGGLAEPSGVESSSDSGGLAEPPSEDAPKEAGAAQGVQAPPGAKAESPAGAAQGVAEPPAAKADASADAKPGEASAEARLPTPTWWWIFAGLLVAVVAAYYAVLTFARLEVFKMLLASFFPLAFLILAVLGTIVFGLATPTEAAAVGSLGGLLLAAAYRQLNLGVVRESVFLTAKTSAMVCWLFVGSSIFSAAFALLGGQELIEQWVLSLGLSKIQFLLLSQAIIFLLGWPLEWTEIIVIFMPIFIPLLDNFGVDPLFFGLLVALNLQTAFLSPPVAMAAFYLKGVAPPHVTLNQIFVGMIPFMLIQIVALALLYLFPAIGLWLPEVLYK
ncbi:MAG: TRAP transporter large permease subunit [Burkholderiaceae bacterium]|nr:TRAP transporter large permease subunit [Burkholderiales bacterium]MCZ8340503.1 TRAP transporter large permease subunit [Burkholderiaceae bacterium]